MKTDKELEQMLTDWANECVALCRKIDNQELSIGEIKQQYKVLKNKVIASENYYYKNRKLYSNVFFDSVFYPCLNEAAACGFGEPTNSNNIHKITMDLLEANYRLTKYL